MARGVRTSFMVQILIALPALVIAIRTLRSTPLKDARQYEQGDYIPLFANKVYSYQGEPCDAYSYFDLPFCPPGGNKVHNIHVTGDLDSAVDITEDAEIKVNFTYSVFWKEIELEENGGWPRQDDLSTKPMPMPYATAIGICGWLGLLCAVIVPYLRKYFTENSFGDVTEATGFIRPRHIHGDECRCPQYSSLLGAILGVGTQQFIIICFLFILAYMGHLYACNPERLYSTLILLNGITSIISGYKAVKFHTGFTPNGWMDCVIQTGALYSLPVFLTALSINILAVITIGVPFPPPYYATVAKYIFSWCPLTIIVLNESGMWGHCRQDEYGITCATIRFQSQIPKQAWYMKTPAQMFLGGLLPFILIFWMMDDIYASLYNLKVCGAFRTMLTAFTIVVTLTVLMGLGCTHYQLSKKDHQWWWR
ncbi:transmembrane 9 superfamily member 5-like [Fagus crenata]